MHSHFQVRVLLKFSFMNSWECIMVLLCPGDLMVAAGVATSVHQTLAIDAPPAHLSLAAGW